MPPGFKAGTASAFTAIHVYASPLRESIFPLLILFPVADNKTHLTLGLGEQVLREVGKQFYHPGIPRVNAFLGGTAIQVWLALPQRLQLPHSTSERLPPGACLLPFFIPALSAFSHQMLPMLRAVETRGRIKAPSPLLSTPLSPLRTPWLSDLPRGLLAALRW